MQLEDSRAPALHRGENPHTWSWCLLRPSPVPLLCSCVVELLRLCVQGCALLDRGESRDLQGLARLCASLHPWVLLAQRALLLAHDLAVLVLGQVLSSQATNGLGLASAEHHGIGHATPSNLAHALLLHCLHGLHGCLLLHDLHGLHGCLLLHHLHGFHGCLLLHRLHGLHGCLLLHHLHGIMAAFFFITFMAFMAAFFFITFMAFIAAFFFITFGAAAAFMAFIAFAMVTWRARRLYTQRLSDVAAL